MPLKLYCPNCSAPTEYTLTKPLFCGACGNKFAGSISVASQKTTIKSLPRTDDNIEIENNSSDISQLRPAIEVELSNEKGIKFGELAKQEKTGFTRGKPKKVNKKKEFEAFLSQAQNTKKSIEIEDSGAE